LISARSTPWTPLGSSSSPPDPLAGLKGPTSKGREGIGWEEEERGWGERGWERKERERKEGEGAGGDGNGKEGRVKIAAPSQTSCHRLWSRSTPRIDGFGAYNLFVGGLPSIESMSCVFDVFGCMNVT